ncbi:hypothetical protein NXS08_01535 [Gleimia sp. 6138-11-ORH1]|uniref:hypothetical protein n=1 Tax=Gleimia sp. 6138-11-ORH1 TaxID=2973937 RepID=UPI0021684ED5|nr:hypothetical protein [Gleimia sp. 6138-11-ORH1]MCS4484174.1 hypothetical protein [Gleimia sp. 6138-11-ORH1]
MEQQDFIGMPALRSALKIIYTPGINLKTPIGLRNDPQAALILENGRELDQQFTQASEYLDPFDRRDYLAWLETADGVAFSQWKQRAFALAAALQTLETGWEQDEATQSVTRVPEEVQNAVDRAWAWDHNRHWFLVFCIILVTAAFMTSGPDMSASTLNLVQGLLGLAAGILMGYAVSFWPRWQLRKLARKHGIVLEAEQVSEKPQPVAVPLWDIPEGATELSSARILNFANWVMLAQPGKTHFLDLTPGRINTKVTSERHRKIVETAQGWIDKEAQKKARLARLKSAD